MTEHEKQEIKKQRQALLVVVHELEAICGGLGMILTASETGDETNMVEQTLNDPFVRTVGKRLADGDKELTP